MEKKQSLFHKIHKRFKLISTINGYMGYSFLYFLKCYVSGIKSHARWKNEAKELAENYKYIKIYTTYYGRIGETIGTYYQHLCAYNDDNTFKLLTSNEYKYENKRLLKVMSRNIPFIMEESYARWIYILLKNVCMIDDYVAKYLDRATYCEMVLDPEWTKTKLVLSDEEIAEAKDRIKELNICEPYICIHNRDRAYLRETETSRTNHKYRNFPVSVFSKTAEEFSKKGIQLVRMGQLTESKVDFDNCFDYANEAYDELLDLYLFQNCKFAICSESGINFIPRAMNVPLVVVNPVPFTIAKYTAWAPMPKLQIFILPKYYDKAKERYLNLVEICDLEKKFGINTQLSESLGVDIIHNTAEEIYYAAEEMNQRIDGTWNETCEDRQLQERFFKILYDYQKKLGYDINQTFKGMIGTKYLRDNMYLIEI